LGGASRLSLVVLPAHLASPSDLIPLVIRHEGTLLDDEKGIQNAKAAKKL
jgi:hypothetical protein